MLARILRIETLADVADKIGFIGDLFAPPGWLALLLTARWPVWLLTAILGPSVLLLAIPVALRRRVLGVGWALSVISLFLLLVLFYSLPDISSLGERPFPSILAIAVPVLGAHLMWIGPVVMIAGLGFLTLAGLIHSQWATNNGMEEQEDRRYDGVGYYP
jgi:hypothetical protein